MDQSEPAKLEPTSVPSLPIASTVLTESATASSASPTTSEVLGVVTAIPTEVANQDVSVGGTWVGGFQLPGGSIKEQRVVLNFTESNDSLEGLIELPLDGTQAPLDAISLESGNVRFAWGADSDETVFDGQVIGHWLEGSVQRGTEKGSFAFVRMVEPSEYTQFAGAYRFPSGHAIGFYEPAGGTQIFPTRLMYADFQTGELGAAFPTTDESFAIGPVIGLAYPFRAVVEFERDAQGVVSGLKWTQPGSQEMTASKIVVNSEEVTFPSGDGTVTLAGRLITPQGEGKHPVVIIVHGAGEVTRKNFLTDMLSGVFAANGIATFSYDKRGVGDSGGTYVSRGNASASNLEILAGDALASVEYLKGRAEIDPAQIGMQGNSQAGWIIPLAAAKSTDVAFMIMWSGPGVSQGISDLYDRMAEGMDADELTRLLKETPPYGFDPVPSFEQISAPGFWAFGDVDKTVPVPESIANLEKVKAEGQKDFTWQIFPNGDHFLIASGNAPGGDLRYASGYVPGLLDAMRTWLRVHTHIN